MCSCGRVCENKGEYICVMTSPQNTMQSVCLASDCVRVNACVQTRESAHVCVVISSLNTIEFLCPVPECVLVGFCAKTRKNVRVRVMILLPNMMKTSKHDLKCLPCVRVCACRRV